jgi:hypothetical protein
MCCASQVNLVPDKKKGGEIASPRRSPDKVAVGLVRVMACFISEGGTCAGSAAEVNSRIFSYFFSNFFSIFFPSVWFKPVLGSALELLLVFRHLCSQL